MATIYCSHCASCKMNQEEYTSHLLQYHSDKIPTDPSTDTSDDNSTDTSDDSCYNSCEDILKELDVFFDTFDI